MASMMREIETYQAADPELRAVLDLAHAVDVAKMMEVPDPDIGRPSASQDDIDAAWDDVEAAYDRWCSLR